MQEAGGRRQEARRQEAGGGRQEAGSRRQEAGEVNLKRHCIAGKDEVRAGDWIQVDAHREGSERPEGAHFAACARADAQHARAPQRLARTGSRGRAIVCASDRVGAAHLQARIAHGRPVSAECRVQREARLRTRS